MAAQNSQERHPLRPTVSNRDSTTYELAEGLARILRPLVGNSPNHFKNTKGFLQQIQGIQLQHGECISSYGVFALFTSVSYRSCHYHYKMKLELDQEVHLRTSMIVEHIISLLEFCLKTTYFQFQGTFFEQLQGTAMEPPISLIVANVYMEDFEIKAINSAEHPPRVWKRYVVDTFVVIESCQKERSLKYINRMDPHIQFTAEDGRADGSIPFLDTLMMPKPYNSLTTTVYRKPTQTDYTCNGTVITIWLPSSVLSTLQNTEQRPSAQTPIFSKRKKTTSDKHYRDTSTL